MMTRKVYFVKILLISCTFILFSLIWSNFITLMVVKSDQTTINQAIDDYREQLREELKDFNYPNGYKPSDLIPESNGNPLRFLVVTTWRSGSSFFGQLLSSIPGIFYEYEPLVDFGIIKIKEPPLSSKGIERIYKLFYCDYYNMDEYFEVSEDQKWPFNSSKRIWSQCEMYPSICFNKEFIRKFCGLFPFHLIKVVRLRLDLVEELLANEKLNLKVIYLVRDPRGTMQSRKHTKWCFNFPDCNEPSHLCDDLVSDYKAAVRLKRIFPNTFRVIRYEDLALDLYNQTEEIIRFLQLYMHPNILEFLDTHTKEQMGDVYSTYRNTRRTPFHWREDLNYTEVKRIEHHCSNAMKLWGYQPVHNQSTLKRIKTLTNYTLDTNLGS